MKKKANQHISRGLILMLTGFSLLTACENERISYALHTGEQTIPLTGEEEGPGIHMSVKLLTPEGISEKGTVIRDSILSWSLGKKYTQTDTDSSIARFMADRHRDYVNTNLEFYKDVRSRDSTIGTASFSSERIIENAILMDNDNYLSIIVNDYSFDGGAHGSTSVLYRTLNKRNCSTVTLEDLFKTRDGLDMMIRNSIAKSAGYERAEKLDEDGTYFAEYIKASENFILEENGVRWIYNQYEIRPYAYGTTEVFLSFDELSSLLKDSFLETLL